MNEHQDRELRTLLESFRHHGGTRVQQHLLYHDLHGLVRWCHAHPETVSRDA